MSEPFRRVRIEELDWLSLAPGVRLLGTFRMAIHPPKMLLALFLVVLLYLGGTAMDTVWQARIHPDEFRQWVELRDDQFALWQTDGDAALREQLARRLEGLCDDPAEVAAAPDRFARALAAVDAHYRSLYAQAAERAGADSQALALQATQIQRQKLRRMRDLRDLEPRGVFATALRVKLQALEHLVDASTSFRLGLRPLLARQSLGSDTVLGALRDMVVLLPAWLLDQHRWFVAVYLVFALVLVSLLGGALARMAAMHACRGERRLAGPAVAFALQRWGWFAVAPLLPILLVLILWAGLGLMGLLFNWRGLDVLGALLVGLAVLLGAGAVLLLAGLGAGASLVYASVAVEGTDAFDALARVYNYVLGRPWRWVLYNLAALVYGAVTYLAVGGFVFLALRATHAALSAAVFRTGADGVNRLEAIWPRPEFGHLAHQVDWAALGRSGQVAAVLVSVWVYLAIGLLGAYAISYYFSANTWIYLLLRRSADGTEFDEVYLPPTAGAGDGEAEAAAEGAGAPKAPDKAPPA